jgi:hypothetical protein
MFNCILPVPEAVAYNETKDTTLLIGTYSAGSSSNADYSFLYELKMKINDHQDEAERSLKLAENLEAILKDANSVLNGKIPELTDYVSKYVRLTPMNLIHYFFNRTRGMEPYLDLAFRYVEYAIHPRGKKSIYERLVSLEKVIRKL